jgi:putative DNA primase/helicase
LIRDRDDVHVDPPSAPLPNARSFVDDRFGHPTRALLVCHGGAFFAWTGSSWSEVEDDALRGAVYRRFEDSRYFSDEGEVRPFRPDRRKVADIVDALKAVTHLPREIVAPVWLDGDRPAEPAEVVAFTNGLLHVPTRTLLPHTPSFYCHHAVPFRFDPRAPDPDRWIAFLNELWPEDPEAILTLRQWFGYLLAGDTSLQKMLLLVGPRRSGKGTIARVLTALLGHHNVAGPTLASLATNFGLSPLVGKPLAIVADARITTGQSVVTERLLSISGEDTLTVDRKYREPWTGRFPTRFVILSNELPRLADASGALASRFLTLVTTRSFLGRENPALIDELTAELPGILNWSLDGLDRLRTSSRFTEPTSSRDAVLELEDLASPIGAFVRERCTVGPSNTIACDALYTAWRAWCDNNGRDRPGTAQTFGRDLRAAVIGLKTTRPRTGDGRTRTYTGITLAAPTNNGPDCGPTRTTHPNAPVRDGPRPTPLSAQHLGIHP